mgnify:CR=1 FL=1
MKNWATPEVEELNINETANGIFNIQWETPWDILGNDEHKKPSQPDNPVTPDDHS